MTTALSGSRSISLTIFAFVSQPLPTRVVEVSIRSPG